MLTEQMARVYLGGSSAPESVMLGLRLAGTELEGGGYQRFEVRRGDWTIENRSATARATWGPFTARTRFDEAVVMSGRQVLKVVPFDGTHDLLAGVVFEGDVTLTFEA